MVNKKKLYSFICIILGLLFMTYGIINYYQFYKRGYIDDKKKDIDIKEFYDTTSHNNYIENSTMDIEEQKVSKENTIDNVIAIINIPKINLERGLYDINSEQNNVDYNVEILDGSIMPNEENSHLFLASHSGSSKYAYFNDLSKLEIGDKINLFFEGTKYIYEVNKIFEVEKDEKIDINGLSNVKMLTLITCHIGTNKQIVVNSHLIEEEIY